MFDSKQCQYHIIDILILKKHAEGHYIALGVTPSTRVPTLPFKQSREPQVQAIRKKVANERNKSKIIFGGR